MFITLQVEVFQFPGEEVVVIERLSEDDFEDFSHNPRNRRKKSGSDVTGKVICSVHIITTIFI